MKLVLMLFSFLKRNFDTKIVSTKIVIGVMAIVFNTSFSMAQTVINEKYDELHKSVIDGNVYHAILCAKDVCETVMKIPAVMGLIIINAYIENENDIREYGTVQLWQALLLQCMTTRCLG